MITNDFTRWIEFRQASWYLEEFWLQNVKCYILWALGSHRKLSWGKGTFRKSTMGLLMSALAILHLVEDASTCPVWFFQHPALPSHTRMPPPKAYLPLGILHQTLVTPSSKDTVSFIACSWNPSLNLWDWAHRNFIFFNSFSSRFTSL